MQLTNGLASIHVNVLLEDSRSNLWAGTWQGLHLWEGSRFRPVLGGDSPGFSVSALHEDSQGNLWGGSNDRGLFQRTAEGAVRYYGREAGLDRSEGDQCFIRAITEDSEGRICLAVWARGLYRLVGEKFEKFGVDRWPGSGVIHGLHADRAGGIWIATEGAGVFCFKDGQFRQWTSADGLPDMLLRAVVPDDEGNLWFSSNKGIFGCSREALEKYERGKSSQVLFWRLSVRDGLPGKLASGAGQPVAARSADGRLWFPNYRALAGFDPAVVRDAGRTLAPMIEEVLADGVPVPRDPAAGLRVRSGVRRFEFHYTCADLRAPERLRFQYQLDGIDDRPREAGAQRVAVYGPLPPGKYVFHVKAGWHLHRVARGRGSLALNRRAALVGTNLGSRCRRCFGRASDGWNRLAGGAGAAPPQIGPPAASTGPRDRSVAASRGISTMTSAPRWRAWCGWAKCRETPRRLNCTCARWQPPPVR